MNALSSSTVIQCQQLSKEYLEGERPLQVLDQVSLTIAAGECVAIVGRSGSGKSTLLHMLGGLDTPSQGEVWLNGEPLAKASERQLAQWRNQYLGFVYQFHHLLPEFTALENVAMPLLLANHGRKQAKQRAAEVLDWVGLTERLQHKPAALSGGERQRTAIARALIQQPRCVLADEPTGNLDPETAQSVFELLLRLNREQGMALVVVTHDLALAQQMDRVVEIRQGQVQPWAGTALC